MGQVKIAALYVDENGVYSDDESIDVWHRCRDARKYAGPFPVVAHPPCNLWGKMAIVNYTRWGGDHNKPGNDAGAFKAAFNAVNKYGGVLEHPAGSGAFFKYVRAIPSGQQWQKTIFGGWVCECYQSDYGHLADKKTWLYYCGDVAPPPVLPHKIKGVYQIGHDSNYQGKPVLRGRAASATPEPFRQYLISLATCARKKRYSRGRSTVGNSGHAF